MRDTNKIDIPQPGDQLLARVLKDLEEIEAWAAGLQERCYRTRKLIQEAGVSTPAKGQSVLSDRQLAELSARRKARMKKGG